MKSYSVEGLVLKRTNVGETDRVLTLLTREQGRLACIAKGVRSITSSRRAFLEPGNVVKALLVSSSGLPILTQATLIDDSHEIHHQLPKIRQLLQVLEMVDALFMEGQADEELFAAVLDIRKEIVTTGPTSGKVVHKLERMIEELGYQPLHQTTYSSLAEYVSVLADKPMKTWKFLNPESGQ